MGAYVSVPQCHSYYNITLKCEPQFSDNKNTTIISTGDFVKGEFEGDGDIAGVGIFASFLAVTSFALLLSMIDLVVRAFKWWINNHELKKDAQELSEKRAQIIKPSWADILEAMIVSCSDTQVFTGAAYAITLRYFRGCLITAYHYNIVANMMLLTCATHLMSITVVRDYWKFPWLAALRVVCITGVFLVTGILLANQNADLDVPFPTDVPRSGDTRSLLFMAAACFQSADDMFKPTMRESFQKDSFRNVFVDSAPGNHIFGWNKFLVILLWYAAAFLYEVANFLRRGSKRPGKRLRFSNWVKKRGLAFISRVFPFCVTVAERPDDDNDADANTTTYNFNAAAATTELLSTPEPNNKRRFRGERILRKIGRILLRLYAICGIAICTWTVVTSAMYIREMRQWVQRSGWLALDEYGNDAENNPTTFGQTVPMCTSGLILFTLLEMGSQKITAYKDAKYAGLRIRKAESSRQMLVSSSSYNDQFKSRYTQVSTSVPETPLTDVSLTDPNRRTTYTPGSNQNLSYFPQTPMSGVTPIPEASERS